MLTVLGPCAATGFEYYGVVRRDRSTAREFTDKSISFISLKWREDGRVFAGPALDHSYRCGKRDKRYSQDPQESPRNEISAHQWNI